MLANDRIISLRPSGLKEGVLVAWGLTEQGERVLLSVTLGMGEGHEDWLELARDLIARGLSAPMLVVADGAPGLIKAIEQCWPASDRSSRVDRNASPEKGRVCREPGYIAVAHALLALEARIDELTSYVAQLR